MIPSNLRTVPAESQPKKAVTSDSGAHDQMAQQAANSSHGHEMHPQKLVRLVGCHDQNAVKHEAA
jgi:hypothetical protein